MNTLPSRASIRFAPWVLAISLVASACNSTDTTTSPPPPPSATISTVVVVPATASVIAGQTTQLNAAVSAVGVAALTVTWSSGNPAVATVNSTSGLVTGVAAGTATIIATSTFDTTKTGTATVTVTPSAGVTSVAVAPQAATIAIGATLPLTPTVVTTGSAANSVTWSSANPAVATVSAGGVVTGVTVGTAQIVATSTFDQTKTGSATITVAQAPTISLGATTASFSATAGTASPAAQAVQVSNSGSGSLSGLGVGTITYLAGQPTGWLAATISGATAPATVTLTPTLGALQAGTYTAMVPVTSSAAGVTNSPATITVTFVVGAPPTIGVTTMVNFSAPKGGVNPPVQLIPVTNIGTGTLSGLALGAIVYQAGQPTGWLSAQLNPATAPATITTGVTLGVLQPGTYTATLPVTSTTAGVTNSPQNITVTFTVTQAPVITLAPSTATFFATSGGLNPPSAQLAILNGGTGVLNGLAIGAPVYTAGQPTGWLTSASLSTTTAPAVLNLVASVAGLTAGTYTATIPVTSTANGVTNSPLNATVTFIVSCPGVPFGLGSVVNTTLTAASCVSTDGFFYNLFTSSLPFDETVLVTVSSASIIPAGMAVEVAPGVAVGYAEAAPFSFKVLAPAGPISFWPNGATAGVTGTLVFNASAPAPGITNCEDVVIVPGGSWNQSLDPTDCASHGVYFGPNFDRYFLKIPGGATVTITMSSGAFVPGLVLFNSSTLLIQAVGASNAGVTTIIFTNPAGPAIVYGFDAFADVGGGTSGAYGLSVSQTLAGSLRRGGSLQAAPYSAMLGKKAPSTTNGTPK